MALRIYNTLSRKEEAFEPLKDRTVGMYNCGPTVYDYAHIGNLRAYVFSDVLRRTLQWNGYGVTQIMNITDVGHLASDADEGEDKMTRALQREGKPLTLEAMKELASFYEARFVEDLDALNIERPTAMPRASEHVSEDIALVKALLGKGHAYQTSDGIYFDVRTFPDYGLLTGHRVSPDGDKEARIAANPEKRSPIDFALWKFDGRLGWDSPWGKGFPGWHIECSAMAMKHLGKSFDIHTGGIDHIPVHHTNEIAQSEAATGKQYAKYWMHGAFLNIGGDKVSKSLGNVYRLKDLEERGIDPLAYRLWLLMAQYRSPIAFSWEAVAGAQSALEGLRRSFLALGDEDGRAIPRYLEQFTERINDDLNTPQAVALLWEALRDDTENPQDRKATVLEMDKVLGLGFSSLRQEAVPPEILKLMEERQDARERKDFPAADRLRDGMAALGWEIEDTPDGQKARRK